jgi:hypothetical protein
METLQPVYNVHTFKSSSTTVEWSSLEAICQSIRNGWAIFWQHHSVFTGQISNGKIQWLDGQPEPEDNHLVRLRTFNEDLEYHFWRSGQEIRGRLRSDGLGDDTEYIDTSIVLRSVVAKPLKNLQEFTEAKISICTRSYIGYNSDTYQAGYVDSRFVYFIKK